MNFFDEHFRVTRSTDTVCVGARVRRVGRDLVRLSVNVGVSCQVVNSWGCPVSDCFGGGRVLSVGLDCRGWKGPGSDYLLVWVCPVPVFDGPGGTDLTCPRSPSQGSVRECQPRVSPWWDPDWISVE